MPAIQTSGGGGTGNGAPGATGANAYQLAVSNGYAGTLQQWLASLRGTDGTNGINGINGINGTNGVNGVDAPSPLLNTSLSGGTDGNIVIRSSSDPTSTSDVVNTMKDVLFDGSPLYFKRAIGEYYGPGGVVPGTFAPGDVGKLVALGDKASANGANLILYTRGAAPATLTPSATRVFQPLGVVESQTSWRFLQLAPITEADNPVQTFESFAGVTSGAVPPTSMLNEQWNATNETMTIVVDAGSTPTWPQGRYAKHTMSSALRHAWVLTDKGQFADGSVGATFAFPAVQTVTGRAARVYLRVGGVSGTETGITADLSLETGRLKIFTYLNGSGSADLVGTTVNAVTGAAFSPLVGPTLYRLDLQAYGNRVRARAYLSGGTVPDWQIECYQSTVTAAGYAGVAGAGGQIDLRYAHAPVTQNYGDLKQVP